MILPMKNQFLPLRIVCCVGFLRAFANIFFIYSPTIWQVNAWYPSYFVVGNTVAVIALGGLWVLRRWAFPVYAVYALFAQVVPLLLHRWDSSVLILPLLTLMVAAFYYRKMK